MPEIYDPRTRSDAGYCTFFIEDTNTVYNSLDFMLILTNVEIEDAQARRYTVDVPGRDGTLDLSEALGGVYFANREITLEFACINYTTQRFIDISSRLRNALNGRMCRLTISSDIAHFWRGRCQVDSTRGSLEHTAITVTMNAEPHKYSVIGSYEPWQWSPFSFIDGTTVTQKDVVLNNQTKTVTLPVDPARGKPVLWLNTGTSGAVQAKLSTQSSWQVLRIGKNTFPEIRMSDRFTQTLQLKGKGSVGVDYRIGSL